MNNHNYFAHHGIKGMKWGVRRFRNKDGSLTEAGKERYKVFDAEKQKVKGFISDHDDRAKALAFKAKQLNAAYYDEQDDKKVTNILEELYGSSKGIGAFI